MGIELQSANCSAASAVLNCNTSTRMRSLTVAGAAQVGAFRWTARPASRLTARTVNARGHQSAASVW